VVALEKYAITAPLERVKLEILPTMVMPAGMVVALHVPVIPVPAMDEITVAVMVWIAM
jgi:hypothetical protein